MPADFDPMFETYWELNRLIEDRIIQRFPEIAIASPPPTQRRLRRRYGTVVEKGSTILMDVLSIGVELAGGAMPFFPGIVTDYVVDAVRDRIDPPRPFGEGADHARKLRALHNYLTAQSSAETMNFSEEIVSTSSFQKEIVVG